MHSETILQEIAVELDKAHLRAKTAFAEKNIDRYMGLFSSDLAYTQLNGKTISFAQLKRDVATQFGRVSRVESSFSRDRIEASGSEVVEHLTQTATAEERVFFLFTRTWNIHRKGIYTWSKQDTGWVISKVSVIEESVR